MERDRAAMVLLWELTPTFLRLYQRLTGQRLTLLPLTFPMTCLSPTQRMSPCWELAAWAEPAVSPDQAAVAGQPEARLVAEA
jgi:hypothetical protein